MAVPRSGQLGTAALGSLWLAAPSIWALGTRTTVHVSSALSDAGMASAMSAAGAMSSLPGFGPSSSVGAAGARSAISAETVKGGVE